jgi:hypothetical protein
MRSHNGLHKYLLVSPWTPHVVLTGNRDPANVVACEELLETSDGHRAAEHFLGVRGDILLGFGCHGQWREGSLKASLADSHVVVGMLRFVHVVVICILLDFTRSSILPS